MTTTVDQIIAQELAEQASHGEGDTTPRDAKPIAKLQTFDDFASWQATTYPDVEWLIENILSRGTILLVVGPTSAGKTWLSLEWGLCMAAGKPWNGRASTPCEVAYLFFEGNRKKYQERARKIAKKHGILNCRFHPIDGREQKGPDGKKLQLTIDNLEPWIVENFKRKDWIGKVKVLFVDPLARLTQDNDENDNPRGTKDAEVFERIAEKTGAAVVAIHHTRKKIEYGARPLDASRGNSAIVSAVPDKICLTIHPKCDGRNGTEKIGRLVGEGRDWDAPLDCEFVWNYGWDDRKSDDAEETQLDFIAYWIENHLGERDSVKGGELDSWQAMRMSGGRTTRSNVRGTALRNGILHYQGKGAGSRWFLGPAGVEEFKKRKDAASRVANHCLPPVELGDNDLSTLVALFKTQDDRPSMAELEKRGKERGMTPAEVRELVTTARDKARQVLQIEGNPVIFELAGHALELKQNAGREAAEISRGAEHSISG